MRNNINILIILFISTSGVSMAQDFNIKDQNIFGSLPLSVHFQLDGYFNGYTDETQPQATGVGKAVLGLKNSAYEVNFTYPGEPIYRKPGVSASYRAIDYDRSGNLVIWRPITLAAYFGSDGGQKISSFELYKVSETEGAVKGTEYSIVEEFNSKDADYLTSAVRMATGTGYSDYISTDSKKARTIDSSTIQQDNGAIGNARGAWVLHFDTESPVIREATFTLHSSGLDTTIVQTSGILTVNNESIAQSGNVKHSANEKGLTVTFTHAEKTHDTSFLAKIKDKIKLGEQAQESR